MNAIYLPPLRCQSMTHPIQPHVSHSNKFYRTSLLEFTAWTLPPLPCFPASSTIGTRPSRVRCPSIESTFVVRSLPAPRALMFIFHPLFRKHARVTFGSDPDTWVTTLARTIVSFNRKSRDVLQKQLIQEHTELLTIYELTDDGRDLMSGMSGAVRRARDTARRIRGLYQQVSHPPSLSPFAAHSDSFAFLTTCTRST